MHARFNPTLTLVIKIRLSCYYQIALFFMECEGVSGENQMIL